MTAAEVLASAAESLRRDPESWYRRGTSLATLVANVPGAGLEERGEAAALLRAHLGGDPRNAYFLADWSVVRAHAEAIQALEEAAADERNRALHCDLTAIAVGEGLFCIDCGASHSWGTPCP